MAFVTYYWNPQQLTEKPLRDAINILENSNSSKKDFRDALVLLLNSQNVYAYSIVFDQYSYSRTEMGNHREEIFDDLEDKILALARHELKQPPIVQEIRPNSYLQGANHASALQVLWRCGVEADIALVIPYLANSSDSTVVACACTAARYLLSESTQFYPDVFQAIRQILESSQWNEAVKSEAVNILSYYPNLEAEKMLVQIAQEQSYPMSGHAVLALLSQQPEKYAQFAQTIADQWPSDIHFPGMYVRQLLSEISAS
ncbi:hypothetical protein ACN4EG_26720 [Alkalinema pantanalense CENA528]|uniref:hypothetical protein n=1 Tax=Alkalinema pantanalense TaxID=1620705 RepID=UPI003D6DEA02